VFMLVDKHVNTVPTFMFVDVRAVPKHTVESMPPCTHKSAVKITLLQSQSAEHAISDGWQAAE